MSVAAVKIAEPPSQLLSVEAALERILAAIPGPFATEDVAVADALWRVPAKDVVAAVSLPPWDNSAMDGYAIRSADVAPATDDSPVELRVIGEAAAGAVAGADVVAGCAVRIGTGAPLPRGADAVVPVELTTPIDAAGERGPRGREASGPLPVACLVHTAVPRGGSVREAGSDLRAGTTILPAGRRVPPAAVALAAGAGVERIVAYRQPRIGVLATGDELRRPGEPLGPAGIPDANGPSLRALVAAAGAEPVDLGIARDALDDVTSRLRRAIDGDIDAIVVSGGVSVGPYDVVKLAFDAVGRIDLWRVAVQPGKPFAFGSASRPRGGTVLLFGLPGNPVSTAVTFELFVRPAIRRIGGHAAIERPRDRAVLGEPVTKSHGRRAYLRMIVSHRSDGTPERDPLGRLQLRSAGGQGSHVLSALAAAEVLAVIPETVDELPAGAEVEVLWLDGAGHGGS